MQRQKKQWEVIFISFSKNIDTLLMKLLELVQNGMMINFTRTFHQVTVKNFTVDELLATHEQKSSEYNQKGHRPKSTVSDQVYA